MHRIPRPPCLASASSVLDGFSGASAPAISPLLFSWNRILDNSTPFPISQLGMFSPLPDFLYASLYLTTRPSTPIPPPLPAPNPFASFTEQHPTRLCPDPHPPRLQVSQGAPRLWQLLSRFCPSLLIRAHSTTNLPIWSLNLPCTNCSSDRLTTPTLKRSCFSLSPFSQ